MKIYIKVTAVLFVVSCAVLVWGENRFDVHVYVDEEYRADPSWFRATESALNLVNTRYAQEFDITFNWLEPVYWESDNAHNTIFDLLDQLVADSSSLRPGIILAFTAQTSLQGYEIGVARYFTGHTVVRKTDFFVDTILHEIGHIFGSVHVEGEPLLMNSHTTGQKNLRFDRWNTDIVKLHATRSFNPSRYPVDREHAEKIVSIYDELLTRGKSDKILLINLGSSLSGIGKHDKAIDILREAETYFYLKSVEQGSDNARSSSYRKQAREALSFALCKKGEWQDAVYILNDLHDEEPGNAFITWYLALAYAGIEDYSRARDIFERLIELMPDSTALNLNLGYVYEKMGIPAVAEEKYRWALHKEPDRHEPYVYLGNFYRSLGQLDDAVEYYTKAITRNERDGTLYELRGISLHKQEKIEQALADYLQAVTLNPILKVSRYNTGLLYVKQNRLDEAEQQFIQLIKTHPHYALGYAGLGSVYARQKKFKESRKMLEKAVKRDRSLADAYANLYHVYTYLGLEKKAKKSAKRYRKLTGKELTP